MKISHLLAVPCAILALSACSSGHDHGGADSGHDCTMDDRGETYVPGMTKTGGASYSFALLDSNPAPPDKGDNIWKVEVRDADDNPAAGMTLQIKTFMPDHQHGSPIVPTVTDEGGGVYSIDPVNLFMAGYWEVDVSLVDVGPTESPDDDVILSTAQFKFCVDS